MNGFYIEKSIVWILWQHQACVTAIAGASFRWGRASQLAAVPARLHDVLHVEANVLDAI